MHPILAKTFGGLSTQYYVRQFLFGLIFPALMLFAMTHSKTPHPLSFSVIATLALNTFLYPYSRFVYESVVNYIMGGNLFFLNALIVLFTKLVTMMLCWALAIFIAPIGLVYLYFHHSRRVLG